jgi:transposase, IS30 family
MIRMRHRLCRWGAQVPSRMAEEKRLELRRLVFEQGMRVESAAEVVGCKKTLAFRIVRESPRPPPKKRLGSLTLEDREEIFRGCIRGESFSSIARRLKYWPSTISREVAKQGGREKYRPWRGERLAEKNARRPKVAKLDGTPKLAHEVERGLQKKWSPAQISARLRERYPHNRRMQISTETIYKSLFVQGRGSLRKDLALALRTGRSTRRARGRAHARGKLLNMVPISERPPEVEDRAVPGHWEGDLITGKDSKSFIGTLVERKTRYLMLLHLPQGKSAEHVRAALTKKILLLPRELRRSITWDQGKEMAEHVRFTVDTGVAVYFCDPHSPWQRGSNENTNGLLRQYFPKGQDLSVHSAKELDRVARELNERPRQTLGWRAPCQAFAELCAHP